MDINKTGDIVKSGVRGHDQTTHWFLTSPRFHIDLEMLLNIEWRRVEKG